MEAPVRAAKLLAGRPSAANPFDLLPGRYEPPDLPRQRSRRGELGRTRGDVASADVGATDTEILLRAERDGNGPGRTYEIIYAGTDASGNATTARAIVSVPHDLDRGP